jgi:hypothetical protein
MKTQTPHATRVPLSAVEIDAMADFLANMHDLPVADLLSEFRTAMLESFPALESGFLEYVYATFMGFSPEIRFDMKFNHRNFVSDAFRSYKPNRDQA